MKEFADYENVVKAAKAIKKASLEMKQPPERVVSQALEYLRFKKKK